MFLFQFKPLKTNYEAYEISAANQLSQKDKKSPSDLSKHTVARFWAMHGKHSGRIMRRFWPKEKKDNDNDEQQKEQGQDISLSKLKILQHFLRIKKRNKTPFFNTEIPTESRSSQEAESFQGLVENEIRQKQRRTEGKAVMVRMM